MAAAIVRFSLHGQETLIAAVLAVFVVLWVVRNPGKGLCAVIVFLPLQTVGFSLLFRFGVPASIVRPLSGIKEALVIGLVLAGLREIVAGRERMDHLDALAWGYIAIATAYLFVPGLFGHPSPPTDPFAAYIQNLTELEGYSKPLTFSVRVLAYRVDTLFVFAFIGARHAPIAANFRRTFIKLSAVVALVAAAGGIWEQISSGNWNHFAVNVLQVPRFRDFVLHAGVSLTDVRYYNTAGGLHSHRVGSIFFDPLTLAFFLLIGLGICVELVARHWARPWAWVLGGLCATALVATQTRSALLGGAVIVLVGLRPRRFTAGRIRARFGLMLIVAILIVIPLSLSTGLAARTTKTLAGGQNVSAHLTHSEAGFDSLISHPLGLGLGTGPAIGNRYDVNGRLTSEDSYLQVGDELGAVEMLLFILLLIGVVRRLGRYRAHSADGDPLAGALNAIGFGLIVGGFFLHIWLDFSLAVTYWAGAGLAIGVAERHRNSAYPPGDALRGSGPTSGIRPPSA
ncbi:MAG: O-antigen ligase family protein [Acidimicrobiales bacterium]